MIVADPALDPILTGGAVAVFLLVFGALMAGKLVMGRSHDEAMARADKRAENAERDAREWRDYALQLLQMSDRSLALTERAASALEQQGPRLPRSDL